MQRQKEEGEVNRDEENEGRRHKGGSAEKHHWPSTQSDAVQCSDCAEGPHRVTQSNIVTTHRGHTY